MNESSVAYASTSKAISEIKMIEIIKLCKNDYVRGDAHFEEHFLQMRRGLENDCDYELAQDGMHR